MTLLNRRPLALIAVGITVAMASLSLSPIVPADASGKDGSGGKGVAHRAGAAKVASAQRDAPSARLHRIHVDGTPVNAVEPTLGLTKDGDIFYTAFQTNTRIEVVHSGDNAQTWDLRSPKIGTRNAHLLSFDPYIYVDTDTDRIFNIDLTVACSYLSFSDDKGKSWITNPVACGRPVNDHQTLFAGPPVQSPTAGYDNIVYYCWNDVGSSSCSKSLDGGISFSPTGSPAYPGVDPEAGDQTGSVCGGLHGHGYVAPDGTVLLPKGHCGQPWLALSNDEGRTWQRVQVATIGAASHEASVAMDAKGNIYYTWIARNLLPYLVVSKNAGKTWSKPMMIGSPGVTDANLPSLAVGDPGKIALVYMGSENAKGPAGERDYKGTTWNGYMMVSDDVLTKNPIFYTATVNDKRDPLVRDTCSTQTGSPRGRCVAAYDFIDVVVGPDGTAWAAFVDGCISICTSPGGSNLGAEAVVGQLVGGPKLR